MYRSVLSSRLPDGLSMPKAHAVMDLDEASAAIWLESVDHVDDELRADLLAATDDLDAIVDELEALPVATLHGDACTRNLLVRNGMQEMVFIYFGFWGEGPVGFDLGQLLLGEVQLGEIPASCLASLQPACLLAYLQGLEAEGFSVLPATVRRAHALQMLPFNGLSSVPFEHLGSLPTPDLTELAS